MHPAIILHGGAGDWPADEFDYDEVIAAMRHAAQIGWTILKSGGSALDAVEKATNYLEDNPLFDAGIGSHLNLFGEVEMDALIVDGRYPDFGAVAGVKHVQHPISLARRIMTDTPHSFFVGAGADALAAQMGFPIIPNIEFVTEREKRLFLNREKGLAKPSGTVGAVARDANGDIASATTTGGTPNKPRGRVGDTPLFGSGGYAYNPYGAASATGVGEQVMRVLLSKFAVDQIALGCYADVAALEAIKHINRFFSSTNVGIIVVDADGNLGAAHTTKHMPIAWVDREGNIHANMGTGLNGIKG